jgi:hypothetical protein
MILKPGVKVKGIRPELVLALYIADVCWERLYGHTGYPMVVTSLVDGIHSHTSLHYVGAAADMRTTWYSTQFPQKFGNTDWQELADSIDIALGETSEFDVVLEGDHIHLEWQPKE